VLYFGGLAGLDGLPQIGKTHELDRLFIDPYPGAPFFGLAVPAHTWIGRLVGAPGAESLPVIVLAQILDRRVELVAVQVLQVGLG
jgi:hypothetical protein